MMKIWVALFALVVAVQVAQAETMSLEDELRGLENANGAPAAASKEKLYAVQTRYLPLHFKHEVSAGGGMNLTGDSFLLSGMAEVGYRFHFNDRWSVGAGYGVVTNKLSTAADPLRRDGVIPDVPYAKS